jgi:hypothetical protein
MRRSTVRTGLVATALLAASLTGTTLTASSAQAGVTVPRLRVDITVTKSAVTVSDDGFAPGNTILNIEATGAGGAIEVMQLHDGYTVEDLQADFPKVFRGKVGAIRRVDKNVEFYGGAFAEKGHSAKFATYLDAGDYLVANLDKGVYAEMSVTGTPQERALPTPTGTVNMRGDDRFGNPGERQHRGWMSTTNNTDEPHFVELSQVKRSTTKRMVHRWFAHGANGQPDFALDGFASTLVVGPAHTVLWQYHAPRGKYLEMCWWPSDEDGMPHAMMGMWALTVLH